METKKTIKAHMIRSIILIILAILTLIPNEVASKLNLIDYKSICSFTPISTIICFGIGVLFIFKAIKTIKAQPKIL